VCTTADCSGSDHEWHNYAWSDGKPSANRGGVEGILQGPQGVESGGNIAKGVILGSVSDDLHHVIILGDLAREMYRKLRTEVVKQSSGSSASGIQVELV